MKQGKYTCRNGKFVHEDDYVPVNPRAVVGAGLTGLTIWFFILMGMGVFG